MLHFRSRTPSLAVLAAALIAPAVLAQSVALEAKPYSGGLLMGRQILAARAGQPVPAAADTSTSDAALPELSCSPAPCVLPNVRASGGTQPVNEDAITANPLDGNDLVTTGNDYNCGSLQGIFSSNDAGTTWRRTCMTSTPGNSGLGDPVPAYDRAGNAYVVGINTPDGGFTGTIAIVKSTNQGVTWGSAKLAVPATLGSIADKPWLEADTTPTSPFVNSLYISVTQFASNSDSQITVSRSRDGGNTWALTPVSARQTFPDVVQFSDLAVGRDGTVYLAYMKCRANGPFGNCAATTATMLFQKSTDGGVTWSAPLTITTAQLGPVSCGAFYGCLPNTSERLSNIPVIAVDNTTGPRSGKLYVALYNFVGGALKVRVVSSTDGGASWSAQKPVAPATASGDQFFPWINVSDNGSVAVTWLDRRNDPSNVSYEAFGGLSTNGGTSYRNVKLSSAASNPFNDGFGGGFMGDYTGNVWVGNTLFMSYMDMRAGISQDWVAGGTR